MNTKYAVMVNDNTAKNKGMLFVRVYATQDEAEEFAQVLREEKGRQGVIVEGVVVVRLEAV